MLSRRILFSSFHKNINVYRASFASKPTKQILGYAEKPDELEITADYIGPPDKKSNIRPILRYIPEKETKLQYELRMKRTEVHEWVDKFWRNHNRRFFAEKEEFVAKHKPPGEDSLHADKMSEFYKDFLDRHWKMHVYFNVSWYIKNFTLVFTALQVNLEKAVNKVRGK